MNEKIISMYSTPKSDIIEFMTENFIMTSSNEGNLLGKFEDNVFGEDFN